MTPNRHRRAFWLVGLASTILLAPAANAQEPRPPTKAERAEARAIDRDLQELATAARQEAATPGSEGSIEDLLTKLGRPERTIQPPSLTSADLDALIQANLDEPKAAPAKLVSDEEFLRRASLDITGKLPDPEQVLAFARNKDPKKRARLIDGLLDSPDYARNWACYWRDVVTYRATFEQVRLAHYDVFESWLADQFARNRPWDEIARALIAAEGNNEENGAVGLTIAHQGRPVEVAGEVSRIFLGVQIACAQCHDHKTGPWTREQFHEFAAFFAGTRARRNKEPGGKASGLTITTRPRPVRYFMPDLEDPQKRIPIQPGFFLASSETRIPPRLTAQQRRELAASLVTGQDNEWFAKSFVNRIWYALIGEAFYEPIDDLGPAREAVMPEVLDRLASEWSRGGFDIRWLFRTILNTRIYQRSYRSTSNEAAPPPFAASCPSRLRSDQILDALGQALDFDPDNPGRRVVRRQKGQPAAGALRAGRFRPRRAFNTLFGVDPSTPNDDVLGTIPQSLFLMNSPQIHRAIQANPRTMLGQLLAEHPDDPEAIQALYLRVLARQPNADEIKTCRQYLTKVGDRREAFEDILWALINSTEFLSRR